MWPDLIKNLLVSACLGGLIGLQRQWEDQHYHPERKHPAGLRTHTLCAGLGTLCAYLSQLQQPLFFLCGFLVMASYLFLLLRQKMIQDGFGLGLTTALAGLITYLTGGLVQWGQWKIALVLSISLLLLLASKRRLHELTQHFTPEDVHEALIFAFLSGIVLQLVPNHSYGPYQAFNPHTIWVMVVLVSGIGFGGYIAVRCLGDRGGIMVTGFLGGLASSTATTLAMSRQSKSTPDLGQSYALAVILACTVMLGRVGLIVVVVCPALLRPLLPGLLLLATPGILFTLWFGLSQKKGQECTSPHLHNPLGMRIALQFALIYAAIVLAVHIAADHYGRAGIYWTSFFSGLTDLDAISVSSGQMASHAQIEISTAANAIIIAALANTLLKGGLACALGATTLRKPILLVFCATLGLGLLWLWL